ncbi:hypothetical protein FA743_10195 [Paracoccus gahaiensis]|uniref:HTH luxR-type domain-containing protein n=1 Tax=Paracoccus gahaiensis TaxID=1706839 RepID=A0A4U0R9G4_9RHOB|nr:hypothetical protein [Paracoccus gahaiensis]TJZ91831.1 hypothetical protein FA743_10195 [Paracoccus gahaiensis]
MIPDPRLLSAVHRAALDPRAWQDVILELERASGGARIAAFGVDADGSQNIQLPALHGSFDPASGDSFIAHDGALNPWARRFAAMPVDQPLRSAGMIADEDLMQTEVCHDRIRPQDDMRGGVGLRLAVGEGRHVCLAANVRQRERDRDRVEDALLHLLDHLTAHLRHALEVTAILRRYTTRIALLEAGVPDGAMFVVLDARHHALLVEPGDAALVPFHIGPSGRFRMTTPRMQDWLEALARPPRGEPVPPVCREGGWQGRAIAVPEDARFHPPVQATPATDRPCLGLIFQPDTVPEAPDQRLRRKFGLTAAEARIALAAAGGASAPEIARDRGISLHTVRNQIKAAIAKTGARRLGDLIRIVTSEAG